MKNYTKICRSNAIVRFQDSDPFNHLNNAKYIDYFMNAREDHLIEYYDLDPYKVALETGKGWVVASNQIAYLKPASTMEKVLIETQLIGFKDQHLFVEGRMFNEDRTEVKAVIWMHFVHFELATQKSASHSDEMVELLYDVLTPVDEKSFDERVKVLSAFNYTAKKAEMVA